MYNHAPADYQNPFKKLVDGVGLETIKSKQEDIFYQDKDLTAFVGAKWWPNNHGHIMIIPNEVYENIYDIPDELLVKIHSFSKRVAATFKTVYGCEGVSIRQHNEPAGNQEVWHYHLHVFPRYTGDRLYLSHDKSFYPEPARRAAYAKKLRDYFTNSE